MKYTGGRRRKFLVVTRSILVWRCVMSRDPRPISDENIGSLQGCLVGGDPEQRARERRGRRRALAISIGIQSVVLAALVLIPLFGKPARIGVTIVPLPPYYSHSEGRRAHPEHPRPPQTICRFCAPTSIPPTVPTLDRDPPDGSTEDVPFTGDGPTIPGAIPPPDSQDPSKPVPPPETRVETPHIVRVTHIDPAMLTRRVEPVYPTLARQIGRGGRVDLRAIIAIDGSIQSLEVVGGDPMFYASALEAVRQWHYAPTVLNGQRVEVDTYITVIYNMQR
jgi:TonB family protein